ncbi:magnesium transporter [Caminibacter mediatlanticus TB-2]|uniref:Magnesium transporter n=1 Tax=Caminibacter mediatlanticus TB-2 TaxID=391592 RepID=A0AAI9AII5_9BACT|nr:CorA family divalent cation transporter [Caminibacter mediatlanticus]EDM24165.1 Mg2+ transporter protein, CorA-like protein [Caminibacter mediatlanticus TB-2]QCT94815.1 magnesium transporter [Caminibacter mediatlanticus TB-2]
MKFNINEYLKHDIENVNHPSDFEVAKDYSVLILRLPYIKNDKVEVFSYGFLIKDKKVYYYKRDKKDFELLGGFNELHNFLDIRIDKILAKLNKFHMQIATMEDDLYEDNIDKSFANEWLRLKKDLVFIERLLGHALIAFERFLKCYKEDVDNFAFKDLEEHFNRAFRFSKNAIEKLDYLYEFFRAKQDEKMNKIMFVLTLISGIFLPLTLITGFFGMNTGGLPLVNDPNGTIKAVVIGIILEIPFVVWLYKMMKS